MAILDQGILGGGRNAVGTVVMTKWRGKDVIRARVTPANPKTAAQTTQRTLFAALTQAGSALIDTFIRPYWRRYERSGRNATTAFNEFVRTNVYVMRSDAVAGAPAGMFDAAQMLLTRGPLAPAEPQGLVDDGAGQTQVTWETAAGPPDDAVAVVVTGHGGVPTEVLAGLTRADGQATISVPFADRRRAIVHVVAYRPEAGKPPSLAFHGSVRYDPVAGADVVVTGAEKRLAYLSGGSEDGPAPDDQGALV